MGFDVGGISISSPGTTLAVASGATSWMRVNASGIVTRPQTPFMRGQLIGRGAPYSGTPLLVTADLNIGGCWNNATGYFTCPVAGYYMVTMGGIMGGMPSYGYPRLYKNGASNVFTHWNHTGSWHYCNLSSIMSCAAGDTISYGLNAAEGTASAGIYGESGHQMFSIALMA
jgi:hypothetical protein